MCLAIPIRVEEVLEDDTARVMLGGVSKVICTALIGDVRPGDYLLLHVGFALARLDPEEAAQTLALMREAAVPGMEETRL